MFKIFRSGGDLTHWGLNIIKVPKWAQTRRKWVAIGLIIPLWRRRRDNGKSMRFINIHLWPGPIYVIRHGVELERNGSVVSWDNYKKRLYT